MEKRKQKEQTADHIKTEEQKKKKWERDKARDLAEELWPCVSRSKTRETAAGSRMANCLYHHEPTWPACGLHAIFSGWLADCRFLSSHSLLSRSHSAELISSCWRTLARAPPPPTHLSFSQDLTPTCVFKRHSRHTWSCWAESWGWTAVPSPSSSLRGPGLQRTFRSGAVWRWPGACAPCLPGRVLACNKPVK